MKVYDGTETQPTPSVDEIKKSIEVLNALSDHPELMARMAHEHKVELAKAAGRFSRPSKREIIQRQKATRTEKRKVRQQKDRYARAQTGIRQLRVPSVFEAPLKLSNPKSLPQRSLEKPRNCYVCKAEFRALHFFYDAMCETCGDFNYEKRFQSSSLQGQVALITGGRVKIGFQAALKLLRAGADVVVTTRFPVDAALRFSREADCGVWIDRLSVLGLDLRHTPSVDLFCQFFKTHFSRLDLLINNAAQTVRRPPGFYAHLLEYEKREIKDFPSSVQKILGLKAKCDQLLQKIASGLQQKDSLVGWDAVVPAMGLRSSAALSQLPYFFEEHEMLEKMFPKGIFDKDNQQVDLRYQNSWRLKLAEVPVAELFEVHLINAIAPFVLCSKLVPLMRRENTGQKHIVNVTAMEGKFHRFVKTDRHPHTNMAKAALNMLTHTSASELAKDGIFMNAVDTGWVTDEDPFHLAEEKRLRHDFEPPLDIVDGAARICDPFFHGINSGKHWSGKFLKDYFPAEW